MLFREPRDKMYQAQANTCSTEIVQEVSSLLSGFLTGRVGIKKHYKFLKYVCIMFSLIETDVEKL